ncbi:MAG: tetratricopeptide repeat protein [Rhodospirillales bacterium]|nr:tetratricopeptide repeat protein [Rhodospirillales bacterium]MBO6788071.1 tetratricopeptide repeat protein [Rhodospirillales bacterium]
MSPINRDIDRQLDVALEQQRSGNLDAAEAIYRDILETLPRHPETHHLLGLLLYQRGNPGAAVDELNTAVGLAPDIHQFRFNLGLVQTAAAAFDDAVITLEGLVSEQPDTPDLRNAYAVALKGAGRLDDAENILKDLTASHPMFAGGHFNLGNLRLANGRPAAAKADFERALELAPGNPEISRNLAAALQGSGDLPRAEAVLREILADNPDDAAALNNLANILRQRGLLDEAEAALARALEIDPALPDAAYSLGSIRITKNDLPGGSAWLNAAARSRPSFLKAKWASVLALPQIYTSADERDAVRAEWLDGLERIVDDGVPGNDAALHDAFAAISEILPFALAYQGEDDRDAMTKWGSHVSAIAARSLPHLAAPPVAPARSRKRIGLVSAHFRNHTVCNLFKGWITGADREEFEIHLISTAGAGDDVTTDLTRHVDAAHLSPLGTAELAGHVHQLACDALFYPDIGMDPRTQVLAALPLAPRQLMSWGHPVTCGMPTIDTFISSELMEPAESQDHYRERLVTLPGLSIVYEKPQRPEDPIPHDYLCAQSLFKIMPEQDALFASILKETPRCTISFIAHPIREITEAFRERLSAALKVNGIDADAALSFIPPCDRQTFLRHLAGARVVLDTIGWSGGNTSLEALAMGTPVVSLPGRFMRGRHTYAMLKMIGADDLIADDPDDYVRIATLLATDNDTHEATHRNITKSSSGLFADDRVIPAFNDLLKTL